MSKIKMPLTLSQIINMNVGFLGIQYSFGLQQNSMTPLYTFLDADPEQLPLLNLAGPITGLVIQPIIGALSDKTWSPRWGRRKPYFMIGALTCSLALLFMPFSTSLWMAASLLWILDAGNNTAMEPYRAFVADKLPKEQFPLGFQTQSFFTGLGITLAAVSPTIFATIFGSEKTASGIPYWVYGAFLVGSVISITSVMWSNLKTPEDAPTAEELEHMRSGPKGVFSPFLDIASAIRTMPLALWQLALVYLFQWYAMFVYWQFISLSVARSIWNSSPENKEIYDEAARWTSLANGFYNIVTFLTAFVLVILAKKYSAKRVHMACLLLAAVGMFMIPLITDKYLLMLPMVNIGIAWASMMGIPYIMVASSIPASKNGVYMGIVNMMIVIPMFIESLTFGYLYKHFLGSDPGNAIRCAGVFLFFASIATLFIKVKSESFNQPVQGAH
ncbi:MAG: MFS transporter [Saprospiraceae bacterium]|nr:MFS transporter [Saprospiraceae bacterium]MBP9193527.1 MFS transporter [Saprospiraceae bacterium]